DQAEDFVWPPATLPYTQVHIYVITRKTYGTTITCYLEFVQFFRANPCEIRDRKEISCAVIEEKNGSYLDDFSAGDIGTLPKEKSSRDESIFPSRTVQVIFLRSLRQFLHFCSRQ